MARCLYIHIPFCVKKCLYCDFYSIRADGQTIDRYVSALCREMTMRRNAAGRIDSVYIGGGTPSILSGKHIAQIMDRLRDNFSLAAGAEITSEANPESLTEDKATVMSRAGINRISLGVQSLNDNELALLGRPHDSTAAIKAFHTARDAGFDNISLDLIYGIPGQQLSTWMNTVEHVLELQPEHISTYELTPEEHTPLYDLLEKGELGLCDEDEIVSMYYSAKDLLAKHGYEHYEISNFALDGRRCSHNVNYWNRGVYLGLGAGSSSFTDECRSSNIADVERYISGIESGVLPDREEIGMNSEDRLKETIFLGLRKTEGFDINLIPPDSLDRMKEALRDMTQQGLVVITDNHLMPTRKGLLLCNEIIVRLMLCID
jgi:oxygen-independent coproporphyrinogen III oxidase